MPKKIFAFLILTFILIACIGLWVFYNKTRITENLLNHALHDFFKESIALKDVHLNQNLNIKLTNFKGLLHTKQGFVPIQIREIRSQENIFSFLFTRSIHLVISEATFNNSIYQGIDGIAHLQSGKTSSLQFDGIIKSAGLEDFAWVNPTLTGSTGQMYGEIFFKTNSLGNTDFRLQTIVKDPGGKIPSHFFNTLLPYLPQSQNREILKKIISEKNLVRYKKAELRISLPEPNKVKIFLNTLVPDYNLNLNLNLEIRVEKDTFAEAARLLNLIQISKQ